MLKIFISCLRDTVCICGQIFMKLAQFVYIINSLNPFDFEKNRTISRGKVAILVENLHLLFKRYSLHLWSNFPLVGSGVLHGLVVKCLTRNPGVLGSSHTGSFGFFPGSVLGQDTSGPQPSTDDTQERHE